MCVLVVSISIFMMSFSCGSTVMAFAAQKIGSKSSVVICTKMSSGVIISDLLFHQKQMKAYEDVGSLWTDAWLYKDHPTLHVLLHVRPKLS